MKKILTIVLLMTVAQADYVNGYFKSDGTYVSGYDRSKADGYKYNNRNSQTNGGTQRDEFSKKPAYNKPKKEKSIFDYR